MSLVVSLRLFPWCMNLRASCEKQKKKKIFKLKVCASDMGRQYIFRVDYSATKVTTWKKVMNNLLVQFLLFCNWLLHWGLRSFPPVAAPLPQTLPWPSLTRWARRPSIASVGVPLPWLMRKYRSMYVISYMITTSTYIQINTFNFHDDKILKAYSQESGVHQWAFRKQQKYKGIHTFGKISTLM